jgi:hypothetical protein
MLLELFRCCGRIKTMRLFIGREPYSFNIEGVDLHGESGEKDVYVRVALTPTTSSDNPYGRKYEAELDLTLPEFQKITTALTSELGACHRVLEKHGLLDEVPEARNPQGVRRV